MELFIINNFVVECISKFLFYFKKVQFTRQNFSSSSSFIELYGLKESDDRFKFD